MPDIKNATALCWCLYRPEGGGDPLRIYNTTTSDVDLVINVKGRKYMLGIMEWTFEPHYVPQAGDMVFRFLNEKELADIVHQGAKARWAKYRGKGLKGHKRDLRKQLERKLVVVTLDAQGSPDKD